MLFLCLSWYVLPIVKWSSHSFYCLSLRFRKSLQKFLLKDRQSLFFCYSKIRRLKSIRTKGCNFNSINLKTRRLDTMNQFGLDDWFSFAAIGKIKHVSFKVSCVEMWHGNQNLWHLMTLILEAKPSLKPAVIANLDFISDTRRFVFGCIAENNCSQPHSLASNTKWSLRQWIILSRQE